MNSQNKSVVLVPGCLLCPVFQVKYDSTKLAWREEIMKALVDAGVGIVQMPCPEALFRGYDEGLSRKPHGVRYYEKLPGFQHHCKALAEATLEQILALEKHEIRVKAILGIENSPTCAVNRIFTYGIGTEHRAGLFVEALMSLMPEKGLSVPIIGITKHKKSQEKEIRRLFTLLGNEE